MITKTKQLKHINVSDCSESVSEEELKKEIHNF